MYGTWYSPDDPAALGRPLHSLPATGGAPRSALIRSNVMNRLVSTLLIIVGIIHLLPLSGVLGAERLMALYSVAVTDQNIEILMRHLSLIHI